MQSRLGVPRVIYFHIPNTIPSTCLKKMTAGHGNTYLAPGSALPVFQPAKTFWRGHPGQGWYSRTQSRSRRQLLAKLLISTHIVTLSSIRLFRWFLFGTISSVSLPISARCRSSETSTLLYFNLRFLNTTPHPRHVHVVHCRCFSRHRLRVRPTAARPRRSSHRSRAKPIPGLRTVAIGSYSDHTGCLPTM